MVQSVLRQIFFRAITNDAIRNARQKNSEQSRMVQLGMPNKIFRAIVNGAIGNAHQNIFWSNHK